MEDDEDSRATLNPTDDSAPSRASAMLIKLDLINRHFGESCLMRPQFQMNIM